jgi:hypothetical protein
MKCHVQVYSAANQNLYVVCSSISKTGAVVAAVEVNFKILEQFDLFLLTSGVRETVIE